MTHPRDMDPNRDEYEYPDDGDLRTGADEHPDNPHPDADGDVTADGSDARVATETDDADGADELEQPEADSPDELEQPDA
ncbi:hypothetical protein [Herbiconiux sp. YIM B11900]|uniref:hypothetical protein n=1 Tax=Herbiconiux sp. YIM B11900 TaxID=3404131 RepID=UPI003F87F539